MNCYRVVLVFGGYCCKVIVFFVLGNDFDSGFDCDFDKNICVFKFGVRFGLFVSRFFIGSCGWLLIVGCVVEVSSENIMVCLVKCRCDV